MGKNITILDKEYTNVNKIKAIETGTEDYVDFYDTSAANVSAEDITEGKIAYSADGEIVGTRTGGGADISEYFYESIPSASSTSERTWSDGIKKLPAFVNSNNMGYLYYKFKGTEIDLSKLDFSKATSFQRMFSDCINIETIDLSNFDSSRVTSMSDMFNGCKILKSLDLSTFKTENVTTAMSMFAGCYELQEINLNNWNMSKCYYYSSMFANCQKLVDIDVSSFKIIQDNTYLASLFYFCYKLKNINFGNLFTSVQYTFDASQMFTNCNELENIPLLDFGKCLKNKSIIEGCRKLKNFGGFKDLGKSYTTQSSNSANYTLNVSSSVELTYDSLMNIINNLYDLNLTYNVANGGTLYTQQLVLGATNIAKLTEDELNIAIQKGWTIS